MVACFICILGLKVCVKLFGWKESQCQGDCGIPGIILHIPQFHWADRVSWDRGLNGNPVLDDVEECKPKKKKDCGIFWSNFKVIWVPDIESAGLSVMQNKHHRSQIKFMIYHQKSKWKQFCLLFSIFILNNTFSSELSLIDFIFTTCTQPENISLCQMWLFFSKWMNCKEDWTLHFVNKLEELTKGHLFDAINENDFWGLQNLMRVMGC